jgi:hypothetical protein
LALPTLHEMKNYMGRSPCETVPQVKKSPHFMELEVQ